MGVHNTSTQGMCIYAPHALERSVCMHLLHAHWLYVNWGSIKQRNVAHPNDLWEISLNQRLLVFNNLSRLNKAHPAAKCSFVIASLQNVHSCAHFMLISGHLWNKVSAAQEVISHSGIWHVTYTNQWEFFKHRNEQIRWQAHEYSPFTAVKCLVCSHISLDLWAFLESQLINFKANVPSFRTIPFQFHSLHSTYTHTWSNSTANLCLH